MAIQKSKTELLDDLFNVATENISSLESFFGLEGSVLTGHLHLFVGENDKESKLELAKEHFKSTEAYLRLNQVYDYAINGVIDDSENYELEDAAIDIVLFTKDVISLISSEEREPDVAWDKIIAMGDGRFALDSGLSIDILKLALLAGVDIRTVRNAISAGDLSAEKVDSLVLVSNRSAQSWLASRKAFKQTKFIMTAKKQFDEIKNGVELGAFLRNKRESLELAIPEEGVVSDGILISLNDVTQLEKGVFNLPINTVEILADFYQIKANDFVQVVMRVFFPVQLQQLIESSEVRSDMS